MIATRLDSALGRLPMYRVVSGALGALVLVALVLAATGRLDRTVFGLPAMLLTLAVLVVASVAANQAVARLRGLRPHPESALITALLLWFLYWPTTDPAELAWLGLVAVLATLSKYVLVRHARHLFNPAAAGVVLLALVGWAAGTPESLPFTTWWIGSQVLLPWVVVAGVLVLWRVRRVLHVAVFVVAATALTAGALHDQALPWADGLRFALESSPVVFFAALMLTEPLTLAPRRPHQVLAALVAAVVFTLPLTALAAGYLLDLGPIGGSYEIALLAANLVAFACGQRGTHLEVRAVRPIGADTVEVAFAPHRRLRFLPGQYVELDLGATGAASDRRGLRRILSISSPPGEEITVAVRVTDPPSAFKAALQALAPGDRVRATLVGGDFVWSRREAPLLLVAGGIGVTPYLSQLRAERHRGYDDVVLVYGTTADPVPYADELAATAARVVLVSPTRPAGVPDDWEHVPGTDLSAELIAAAVADRHRRRTYLSGPPRMVNALRLALPRARVDQFSGY
ncbi:FAD-dependent oxidoreductase [Nocardioides humi]|uniref:FAD-binding FR-type domain-containing protein n=1 Tax=Nocardioides humi TaxID=449461 RepID=A0ABN2BAZ5_9ACTN|nr:FAD-dependent oxidoreductase [Nocardioides humi]